MSHNTLKRLQDEFAYKVARNEYRKVDNCAKRFYQPLPFTLEELDKLETQLIELEKELGSYK